MANIGTALGKYSAGVKDRIAKGGEIIPSGYKKTRIQNYTPEQMKLHESQFQNLGPDSYLSKLAGGDQSFFDEMEAPAHRQFNELQGGIASRFSGQGIGGRKNSGFQNTQNQAASNFAQDLQSKRLDLRNQAIRDLMGMSNTLLGQQPYENGLQKKDEGFDWGGAIGGAVGGVGGFFAGGPMGAMTGAQLGYGIGSGKGSSGNYQGSEGWKPSWNGQGGNTQMQTQRLTR